MFKQPIWIIPVGYYLGVLSILLGIYLVTYTDTSSLWLLVWLAGYVLSSLMVSVGLHRYFSHGAFKTSTFWHNFMAYYSTILLSGSPHDWAAAHNTHHKYSDTEKDSHYSDWRYLLIKKHRNVRMVQWRLKQLSNDSTLKFVHRYGLLLWITFCIATLLISPYIFLYGYLMPLGTVHLIGAIHQITTHKNKTPRDIAWMEFILPACGEWIHKTHHDYPRRQSLRTKWWHLDIGAGFINLIKTDKP